ncbi:unnamed protein product [Durusdinium trenchii]
MFPSQELGLVAVEVSVAICQTTTGYKSNTVSLTPMAMLDSAIDGDIFLTALQQAEVGLQNAHRAVLGTMEAELKHMRYENMRLRGILEEAGLGEKLRAPRDEMLVGSGPIEKPSAAKSSREERAEKVPEAPAASSAVEAADAEIQATSQAEAQESAQWIPMKREGPSRHASTPLATTPSTTTPSTIATPLSFTPCAEAVNSSAHSSEPDLKTDQVVTTPEEASLPDEETLVQKVECPPLVLPPNATPDTPGLVNKTAEEANQAKKAQAVARLNPSRQVKKTLEALLAQYGWQHLEVQILSECDQVVVAHIGGVQLKLRMDSDVTGLRFFASDDEGTTWQALEDLIRRRRLQKVVRACPVATGTFEFTVESPKKGKAVEVSHVSPRCSRQPKSLSLAELAALPIEKPMRSMAKVCRQPLSSSPYPGSPSGFGTVSR